MIVIDTNIILRYLLNDNEDLNQQATEIIDNNDVFIPTEVIVEASYVLQKVYKVERKVIFEFVKQFIEMEGINFQNKDTIELAFKIYSENSLDIVDCMLYAYAKNEGYDVKTFDKKLNKLIKSDKK